MGTIQQKFTGDAGELERELDKMRRGYIRLEEQIAKMARQSKESADQNVQSFQHFETGVQKSIRAIATLASSWLSAQGALNLYKQSLDDAVQKAERARQASMSVAEGQAAVLMNLGNVGDDTAKDFLNKIGDLTKASKFQSQAPMLTAASSILSAVGGDRDKTLGILGTAAPFFRSNQAELATFGGVLGDVMKSSGMQDPNQALAFALGVQGQSRFEQLGGFKNVSPVLAGAAIGAPQADRSLVARQAAAMFAGIGGELGDPEGGVTKTAVLKLIENLSTATGGQGDLFQQLAAVQANPKLRDSKNWKEFEGQAKLLMGALTSDPNSQVAKSINSAFSQIQADPAMVEAKRKQLEQLTPQLANQSYEATSAGTIEAAQISGTRATRGSIRKILKDTLEDQVPFMNRMGSMMQFDSSKTDLDAARSAQSILAGHLLTAEREKLLGRGTYDESIPVLKEQMRVLQQMEQHLLSIQQSSSQTANKPAGQPGGNEPD